MDYYSAGYSQYGDQNAYRADLYRHAQVTAQTDSSAIAAYSQPATAQAPTIVPQVQSMPITHQRFQTANITPNPVHIANMQRLYQHKNNQPQAAGAQNYYQQHWTWQDYQQGVDMGANTALQQQQRMKNTKQQGIQGPPLNQNFVHQSQNPPPQTWSNPPNSNMNDSTSQSMNMLSSQIPQPLTFPQAPRRAQPIYYPPVQTGTSLTDYNNRQKNSKYYPKQEHTKTQFWQNPQWNPTVPKNKTWNNEDNRRSMGYLKDPNQQSRHGVKPPGPTPFRHRNNKFRYPQRVAGAATHKDDYFSNSGVTVPPHPPVLYTNSQQQIPAPNSVPQFTTYNQPPNPYYPTANVPQFNAAQHDRAPGHDRQRPTDGRNLYPIPANIDFRVQPPPVCNPIPHQRQRAFQQQNKTLQVKQSHINQRNPTLKRQQNDRNRRGIQAQKRRKANAKNSTGNFGEIPNYYDNKRSQVRGRAKMRLTMEDGLEAYFKNSFLDDPWSHLTPEETPIF